MRKFLWIILIFVVGCGSWTKVGGLYESTYYSFSIELPETWMRLNTEDYLLITRDGVLLQHILIEMIPLNNSLKHTKKKFRQGMLPHETAEIILDNESSNPNILNLRIIKNVPVKISGLPGFKAIYTHKNKDRLRFKTIYYGFISGEQFYGISYTAASRHYFEKDLKVFQKAFRSFKVIRTI